MELKSYQKQIINDISSYLEYLQKEKDISKAFNLFWEDKIGAYNSVENTGMPPYKNNIKNVPHICTKVPTGGGKTFIASYALQTIFKGMDLKRTKAVVWLVPSVTILEQTIKNLSNTSHPYRQKINLHFNNKVEIYDKDSLLQARGFNPSSVKENLSIFVVSYDSLRARNKDDRKIYQENGQLTGFIQLPDYKKTLLKNTPEDALINVIRYLNPVLIVDESHNATTDLSVEMLKNLNPAFILDLTATPRNNSNIISFTDASELKKECMVKLPVIVHNAESTTEVISNAIQLRNRLGKAADKNMELTGKYIRPIVLFQAQPKSKKDNVTFEKIKEKLLKSGIPEEEIKIKTAYNNELKNIKLLSQDCKVKYIITVNALKEGWDCPFAYILATIANKSSAVDVEQILGRILRQPYVRRFDEDVLNLSFVLTASSVFMETLGNIVKGLKYSGFSEKDYKPAISVSTNIDKNSKKISKGKTIGIFDDISTKSEENQEENVVDEIDSESIKNSSNTETGNFISEMVDKAETESKEYEENNQADSSDSSFPVEVAEKITLVEMKEIFTKDAKAINLPQFVIEIEGLQMFDTKTVKLSKVNLLTGFQLSKQNRDIPFTGTSSDLYKVDIEKIGKKEYSASFDKVDSRFTAPLLDYILSIPKEKQIKELSGRMTTLLGNMYPIPEQEINKYLKLILQDFTSEQMVDFVNHEYTYKDKIKKWINKLTEKHAEKEFYNRIDSDKINVQPAYELPSNIAPIGIDTGIKKSLYGKEGKMNNFEAKAINEIANTKSVVFWTKNIEKRGFAINGFKNHYPDFIVLTKKGTILIVETKGDDRDNSDSKQKLKLGQRWANLSGKEYKYFMVFENSKIEGAYSLTEFIKVLNDL